MAKVVRTTALVLYLWSVFMQFSRMSGLGINELLYFRVISPEEIGYIFSAAPAKDFGGDFTSSYDEIFLVPADPADGCSDLEDREIIQGQVILVERGYVPLVERVLKVSTQVQVRRDAQACSAFHATNIAADVVWENFQNCYHIFNTCPLTISLTHCDLDQPQRGCSFVQKARHVEEAGGKAVLIADNAEDNDSQYLDMITDGSTAKPSIPALFLLGRDGMMIRRSLQRQALPWAVISIPVNVSSLASFPLKQPPWTLW